jgi:hypothetical protein
MFLLLLLAEMPERTAAPAIPARAVVRIERSARADAESWRMLPPSERREIRSYDENGRPTVLRLIEHQ